MAPKRKSNTSGAKSKAAEVDNGAPTEMKLMLQGLGVKKTQAMADVLAENGIETRKDLAGLDDDMRKELDGLLKDGGVSIGDRAKLKNAQNEVNEVKVKIGNGEVSVPQLVPGQAMQPSTKLERLFLGMGWTGKGSKGVDVDASCVAFSAGAVVDMLFFQKLRNDSKSVVHTGDVLTGGDEAQKKDAEDMERIYVWLQKLPKNHDCLVFVANIYSQGVNFSQIENAYIRLVNADTSQELCRVPLSGGGLTGNCLVFCKLYRTAPASGAKGEAPWQLLSLGMPSTIAGMSSVEQIVPMLQKTGCAHPPKAVAGADGPAGKAGPGGKVSAAKGSKAGPAVAPPEKPQKPRSVLPCVALAVAGTAGIAAATAIYMNPELRADMMNSSVYTSCADFGADALQWSGDALVGAGDLIGPAAGEVYGWAGSVVDTVPGMESIGEGLGCVGDFAGNGLAFAMDGAPVAGGAIMDGGGAAVEFLGDGQNWENAGGAVMGAGGDAAAWAGDGQNWENAGGTIAGGAQGAAGFITDGENWENAGGAIAGGLGDAGGAIAGAVDGDGAASCCQTIMGMLGGGDLGGVLGDAVGVMEKE